MAQFGGVGKGGGSGGGRGGRFGGALGSPAVRVSGCWAGFFFGQWGRGSAWSPVGCWGGGGGVRCRAGCGAKRCGPRGRDGGREWRRGLSLFVTEGVGWLFYGGVGGGVGGGGWGGGPSRSCVVRGGGATGVGGARARLRMSPTSAQPPTESGTARRVVGPPGRGRYVAVRAASANRAPTNLALGGAASS